MKILNLIWKINHSPKYALVDISKNTEKKVKQKENEEEEEDKKDEDKSKIIETNLSLNPKVNYLLATALAGQIKTNPCLIEFKLLYFRLH